MKPLRRFHGNVVGARAQPVHVCDKCGAWQINPRTGLPFATPPFFCIGNCDGTVFTRFDSKAEAEVFASLMLRVRTGEIDELETQVRFPLHATTPEGGKVLVWSYIADFRYREVKTGKRVVLDAKGNADTHISHAKRKHAAAEYGVEIRTMTPS